MVDTYSDDIKFELVIMVLPNRVDTYTVGQLIELPVRVEYNIDFCVVETFVNEDMVVVLPIVR
jgi:uridine phosphorylase